MICTDPGMSWIGVSETRSCPTTDQRVIRASHSASIETQQTTRSDSGRIWDPQLCHSSKPLHATRQKRAQDLFGDRVSNDEFVLQMGIAKPQHFGTQTQYDGALVDIDTIILPVLSVGASLS
jgi:hypothetical protein